MTSLITPIVVGGSNPIFNDGQQIAFFGRSNAGKSSTINALFNINNLAKTSRHPGKTVTFNFYRLPSLKDSNNENRYLVDLPGYGYARGGLKNQEKLRRKLLWYLEEAGKNLVLFCLIIDAKAGITDVDEGALSLALENNLPVVLLVNKVDRLSQSEQSKLRNEIDEYLNMNETTVDQVFYYSAKNKRGVDQIKGYLEI